ncbi:MAG TPA: DUF1697 domain-containing protein [Thermomicrobiales bacterium]|nr:DUF1697 domain-containing protein [Thermomicrobiales bacterium]
MTDSSDDPTANVPIPHVALLRGVNVGGKNKLPMKELAALFVGEGCANVRTYIQSGNVVFDATPALAATLPERMPARIAERFGFRAPMVARTAAEMERIVAGNPFLAAGVPETALHVLFLADQPEPDRVATLDPDRSPPEAFVARGREIYLHAPNGLGRSKLTNDYFDRTLATISTGRNWRTVTTLLGMMRDR